MDWVEGLTIEKDPDKVCDWPFDWTDWLAGDTITSRVVTVETGLTLDSSVLATPLVTVWLSGGTPGQTYDVACKITTGGGRTEERTVRVKIKNK